MIYSDANLRLLVEGRMGFSGEEANKAMKTMAGVIINMRDIAKEMETKLLNEEKLADEFAARMRIEKEWHHEDSCRTPPKGCTIACKEMTKLIAHYEKAKKLRHAEWDKAGKKQ